MSTPGLTKPAAYTLYGSGYVCESEASLASSAYKLPDGSRRAKYTQSPHCLVETSAPSGETNPPARQQPSVVLRRRSTSSFIRDLGPSLVQTPKKIVTEVVRISNNQSKSTSIALLLCCTFMVIVVLSSLSAQKGDQIQPILSWILSSSAPVFRTIKKASGFFLFGGAWKRRAGVITRSEWEDEIEPTILKEARRIAREEAVSMAAFRAHRERYAGDKGFPPDYALSSAGGKVLWTRPSTYRQYATYSRKLLTSLFVDQASSTPQTPTVASTVISPDVSPGSCWSFSGQRASIVIRLARPVVPNAVTIEHTPESSAFYTSSAPRSIDIRILPREAKSTNESAYIDAGMVQYDAKGDHAQLFTIRNTNVVAKAVAFDITANHGAEFTCVYRLRVHGQLVD